MMKFSESIRKAIDKMGKVHAKLVLLQENEDVDDLQLLEVLEEDMRRIIYLVRKSTDQRDNTAMLVKLNLLKDVMDKFKGKNSEDK